MNNKRNKGEKMKKQLWFVSLALVSAVLAGGCASKSELESVQTRNMEIGAKADQAAIEAQQAKASADQALLKVNEAVARAEAAEQRALERERIAEEKMKEADAAFKKSMKK